MGFEHRALGFRKKWLGNEMLPSIQNPINVFRLPSLFWRLSRLYVLLTSFYIADRKRCSHSSNASWLLYYEELAEGFETFRNGQIF